MTWSVAMVLLALGAEGAAPPGLGAHLPPLRLDARPTPALDLTLRSSVFGFDGALRGPRFAQAGGRGTDATPTGVGVGGTQGLSPEQCDLADAQARDLLRRRRRMLSTHRAFAIGAWASLLVTEVLGTISAINGDTWFGQGACAAGRPDDAIFGSYGCTGLRAVHLTFAFVTTGLYVTAGALAAAAPDPERASEGSDGASRRLRAHKALAWVHVAGMILMPLLGILAANPEIVVGGAAADAEARRDVARAATSLHQIVGYTTFAAYSAAAVLQFF